MIRVPGTDIEIDVNPKAGVVEIYVDTESGRKTVTELTAQQTEALISLLNEAKQVVETGVGTVA